MISRYIKNIANSHKIILMVFVFALLLFLIFCGQLQNVSHARGLGNAGCGLATLMGTHGGIKDTIFIYLFIFLFTILALFTKNIANRFKSIDASCSIGLIFIKTNRFLLKLYNTILEALRTGILHPQTYNLIFVSN